MTTQGKNRRTQQHGGYSQAYQGTKTQSHKAIKYYEGEHPWLVRRGEHEGPPSACMDGEETCYRDEIDMPGSDALSRRAYEKHHDYSR